MNNAFSILCLIIATTICAYGETCPEWNSITVTTSDPDSMITIKTSADKGRITQLAVTVRTNRVEVPQDSLKDTAYPQLSTLLMGYWTKDLKNFYVSLNCGRLNSFPGGKQPETLWFYFSNGEFNRVERRPAMQRKETSTEQSGAGYPPQGVGSPDP